jgi:Ser/Thr protein kinase RdoA (MazF antagonist)
MLQHIRHRIESSLSAPEREAVDLDRFLCLDVSRGRVDGACCLFFDSRGSGPTLVAKAARSVERRAVYRLDYENLVKLDEAGLNAERETTPRPLGIGEERGVLVTLQSALPGRLMRNLPASELFSPERVTETIDRVFSWLHGFQRAFGVRRLTLDEDAYDTEVLALVRRFLGRYRVGRDEEELLNRRFEQDRRLLGLELPLIVGHGDFCVANLVLQDRGIGAFDWEHPLVHRLPLYDLFFFFSSTRFPFGGLRRESDYSRSMLEVYWGKNYLNAALGEQVGEACRTLSIPRVAVADLFLLALLLRADRKYEVFTSASGISDLPKERLWAELRVWERNAPLYQVRHGVLESLRKVTGSGLPSCVELP